MDSLVSIDLIVETILSFLNDNDLLTARLVSRQFDSIIMGQREHDTEPMLWKYLLEKFLPCEPLRERLRVMRQSGEWPPQKALDYVKAYRKMVYGHPLADADITWLNGMYWRLEDSTNSDFYLNKVAHLSIVCWLDVSKSGMVIPAEGEYAVCVRMELGPLSRFQQDVVFDVEELTKDELGQDVSVPLSTFSWNTNVDVGPAYPVGGFFYANVGTIEVKHPNTTVRLHVHAHNDLGKSGWTLDGVRFVPTKWGAAPVKRKTAGTSA